MRIYLFAISIVIAAVTRPSVAEESDDAYPAIERFVTVLEDIRKRHPDLDRLGYDRLINHALEGMLSSLDPHSSFIHPEMAAFISGETEELDNEIKSLGISLTKDAESIRISAIDPDGPAAKADLQPGTRLLAVNDMAIDGQDLPTLLDLLRGQAGETSNLKLRFPGKNSDSTIPLTHRFVDERSIVISEILGNHPETGYLRLASFGANCAREVEAALDELEDTGIKNLILDLRGNGGGDLHQTVRILGLFLPPKITAVTIRSREEKEEELKTPERQRRQRSYPIAVLQDRGSASASELTAGTLRDMKRATIIGERSYGKGSVQNIIPTGKGTALRLTIATYHTPSGATPHIKGIEPDHSIDFTEDDRRFFEQAARVTSLDPEQRNALEKWQDPAIEAAIGAFAK